MCPVGWDQHSSDLPLRMGRRGQSHLLFCVKFNLLCFVERRAPSRTGVHVRLCMNVRMGFVTVLTALSAAVYPLSTPECLFVWTGGYVCMGAWKPGRARGCA